MLRVFSNVFSLTVISVWLSLELTSEYAATRKQFSKTLSEFGMIQVWLSHWSLSAHPFLVMSEVNNVCMSTLLL